MFIDYHSLLPTDPFQNIFLNPTTYSPTTHSPGPSSILHRATQRAAGLKITALSKIMKRYEATLIENFYTWQTAHDEIVSFSKKLLNLMDAAEKNNFNTEYLLEELVTHQKKLEEVLQKASNEHSEEGKVIRRLAIAALVLISLLGLTVCPQFALIIGFFSIICFTIVALAEKLSRPKQLKQSMLDDLKAALMKPKETLEIELTSLNNTPENNAAQLIDSPHNQLTFIERPRSNFTSEVTLHLNNAKDFASQTGQSELTDILNKLAKEISLTLCNTENSNVQHDLYLLAKAVDHAIKNQKAIIDFDFGSSCLTKDFLERSSSLYTTTISDLGKSALAVAGSSIILAAAIIGLVALTSGSFIMNKLHKEAPSTIQTLTERLETYLQSAYNSPANTAIELAEWTPAAQLSL